MPALMHSIGERLGTERKVAAQRAFTQALRRPRLRRVARTTVRTLGFPEAVHQRLPVDGPFDFALHGADFRYHAGLHDGVGRLLFWAGGDAYEPETLAELPRWLSGRKNFIDVGANTGVFSLLATAADPSITVHAFEPVGAIFATLEENVRLNDLSARVVCNRLAVAAESGEVEMHVPGDTWGNATLDTSGFRGLRGHVERVGSTTIDDYVAVHGLEAVDVIKVDVEGQEDVVLEGARKTLASHRPVVVAECLVDGPHEAVERIMTGAGYDVFHLTREGPRRVAHIKPDPKEMEKNFLFVPRAA